MIVVVMGVAGSGKTTVGRALAAALGWPFADADDFHPPANVARMAAGHPLDDADRAPWLAAIRAWIEARLAAGEDAVVTCSALKQRYRDAIRPPAAPVRFVWLHGPPAVLAARLRDRPGHFMTERMLASQLADLEPPAAALALDIASTPATLVAEIRRSLGL